MSDILLDVQSTPATPGAGQGVLYFDTLSKLLTLRNADGLIDTVGDLAAQNTADVVATGVDTYLTGSAIIVPGHLLQAGAQFRWTVVCTKTAAGTATPIWVIRVGTAGSTADAARVTFTQVAAQTGAIDTAWFDIVAILRNVGAAGVLAGGLKMAHVLAATGFSTLDHNVQQVNSAGFDTTAASLRVGLSVNPGASGVWTCQIVQAQALNL